MDLQKSRRNINISPEIAGGATDIRHLRKVKDLCVVQETIYLLFLFQLGIPAFGFVPIRNTPVRLHGDNECLSVETYLKGIEIYRAILVRIGNVSGD